MTFMRSQMSKDFRFQPVYSAPQTRLLVARLVSYWRYSFASYDTDALVLRNPQPLYERYRDVNVIAGASVHWPQWAGELWGFSMCLGAFMIRSSPETEQLWKAVSKTWGNWGSEQDQFNRALVGSNIAWNHTRSNMTKSQFCQHPYAWEGFTQKEPRSHILLLPPRQFCRGECCDKTEYPLSHSPFIFHGGGGNIGMFAGKKLHMKESGVWFLREDWAQVSQFSEKTERHWLKQLSTL
ncbi:hypothetical protein GBAR_LOCUS18165 [Geodia barretti]|uniref:Nucleotide-diphospho-sugar transferase domain-containing protein n=1 Tax=Geodia barretti TaxID=519541 RepID=A0AA35SNZ2_GEOBA|nr:hypothetical protein GBAR_LOCUS18165 [Geodia barretti]